MKITVLAENNTLTDKYYIAEPALSFYIEIENQSILFDAGYSGIFIENAQKMNIDLSNLDSIVLSHGHNDHTWGLKFLIEKQLKNRKEKVKLIAHPNSLIEKKEKEEQIGIDLDKEYLNNFFALNLSKEPTWLTNDLVFLGEIPRTIVKTEKIGQTFDENNSLIFDEILDDSALVYKGKDGLVIITGCSHSSLINIVDYAVKICNEDRIIDIIGGFHLLHTSEEKMNKFISTLKEYRICEIHPCHCTDLNAKIALSRHFNVREVGVGLELEF